MQPVPPTYSPSPLLHADRDINVYGGAFVRHSDGESKGKQFALASLFENCAQDAMVYSAERFPQPRCLEGTRKHILDDIATWIKDTSSQARVLWLSGTVGMGKSAIMQTVAETHDVAATFFFGKGKGRRGEGRYLPITLAYQLASHIPELKGPICAVADANLSIVSQDLVRQFACLIEEPLAKLPNDRHLIMLIDGLDECNLPLQATIVKTCVELCSRVPTVRVMFASRPEPQIKMAFKTPATFRSIIQRIDMDDADRVPSSAFRYPDVVLLLRNGFKKIYDERCLVDYGIPEPWPSPEAENTIADLSSGQMLFADTVLKIVGHPYSDPMEQLDMVLSVEHRSQTMTPLDTLYAQVLAVFQQKDRPRRVLTLLLIRGVRTEERLLQCFLGWRQGVLQMTLSQLAPVLSSHRSTLGETIHRIAHLSFSEFLMDEERSGPCGFHVDIEQSWIDLVVDTVQRISSSLLPYIQAYSGVGVGALETSQIETFLQSAYDGILLFQLPRLLRPAPSCADLSSRLCRIVDSFKAQTSSMRFSLSAIEAHSASQSSFYPLLRLAVDVLRCQEFTLRTQWPQAPEPVERISETYIHLLYNYLDIHYITPSPHSLRSVFAFAPFLLALPRVNVPPAGLAAAMNAPLPTLEKLLLSNRQFFVRPSFPGLNGRETFWEVDRYIVQHYLLRTQDSKWSDSGVCCYHGLTSTFWSQFLRQCLQIHLKDSSNLGEGFITSIIRVATGRIFYAYDIPNKEEKSRWNEVMPPGKHPRPQVYSAPGAEPCDGFHWEKFIASLLSTTYPQWPTLYVEEGRNRTRSKIAQCAVALILDYCTELDSLESSGQDLKRYFVSAGVPDISLDTSLALQLVSRVLTTILPTSYIKDQPALVVTEELFQVLLYALDVCKPPSSDHDSYDMCVWHHWSGSMAIEPQNGERAGSNIFFNALQALECNGSGCGGDLKGDNPWQAGHGCLGTSSSGRTDAAEGQNRPLGSFCDQAFMFLWIEYELFHGRANFLVMKFRRDDGSVCFDDRDYLWTQRCFTGGIVWEISRATFREYLRKAYSHHYDY